MSFGDAVAEGFRRYVDFGGRSRRSELWWWLLFQFVVGMAGLAVGQGGGLGSNLYGLTLLALFLPTLAVEVRRLHDIGRSGWWLLLSVVPIVGIIVLIMWWCREGAAGPNRFGHDPKGAGGEAAFGAPPPFGAPPAPSTDQLSHLEQLGRLRAQGVLTEAEFEAEKAKLLGGGAR